MPLLSRGWGHRDPGSKVLAPQSPWGKKDKERKEKASTGEVETGVTLGLAVWPDSLG